MKFLVIAVVGAALFGGTALVAAPQDAAKIAAGKEAYTTQKCATCHSIKGVGAGAKVGSALDGVGAKLTAADMKKWFVAPAEMEAKLPKKPMVTMSGYLKTHKLTDADVDALVAYMMSLK